MKRRTFLATAPALAAVALARRAGWLDLINGARVGQAVDLSPLRYVIAQPAADRRLTMLYFWATWCGPCREDMPLLNALHASRLDKGLSVVAVTSETEAVVDRFSAAVPIRLPVGLDSDRVLFKALGVRGIPYSVLVNRAGRSVWVGQREELSDTQLDRLLAAGSTAS
jgi:thiol-disulfide isomerase/thioredoxin